MPAMGLSSYWGPLGLQALLEKVLEQLGDVDISLWRCSPCARCGISPKSPLLLCLCCRARGSFSPAQVQEVWKNSMGGGCSTTSSATAKASLF